MLRLKPGITELHYLIILIFAVLVSIAGARGQSQANASDTLVSLGTRVFDLRERYHMPDLGAEGGTIILSDVDWIGSMFWSDPLMTRTAIFIEDRGHGLGSPGWHPDYRSRFRPDPTLPPFVDLDFYKIGWMGVNDAPVRGDLLIFPRHDPQSFYAMCAYDRADPGPTFCSVNFRYGPDPNLFVNTRLFYSRMPMPMNDFDEIVARLDALLRCLDVTEAVRAGEINPSAPSVLQKDIAAGGRCRILPTS